MRKDKIVEKINDDRLKNYTERMRSGAKQVFYTGNDHRDWERYKEDGGGRLPAVKMHDKPDTITIEPPEKHYYSQLIDGEWYWVNGCEECNGRTRNSWSSYIECEKHNVCRSCGIKQSELTEPAWGGKEGWTCEPCANTEKEAWKKEKLAEVASREYCESDYQHLDLIKCPHCGVEEEADSEGEGSAELECDTCGGEYLLETEYSVSYSTTVINDRIV